MGKDKSKIEEYLEMGNLYLEDNLVDDALSEFTKAFEIDSKNLEVLKGLGYSYFLKGSYDEALKYFKMLLDAGEDTAPVHYNLGLVYYKKGDLKQAEIEFNRSVKIDKNFVDSYFYLGKVYKRYNSATKAIFYLRNYIKLQPDTEYKKIVLEDIWKLLNITKPESAGQIGYSKVNLYPNKQLNILYHSMFKSAKKIKLHWGRNNWNDIHDDEMINEIDDFWFITLDISPDIKTVEFAFITDKGECDNNNGKDWKINI